MIEQRLEQTLRKLVERQGGRAIKFTGWSGAPDRIVLFPGGRVVFVEMKAPGGKVRPLQKKRHQQLKALGFEVWVIDSLEGINAFIEGR
jgi:hypothetical protein